MWFDVSLFFIAQSSLENGKVILIIIASAWVLV
jgi:hypothetical protein